MSGYSFPKYRLHRANSGNTWRWKSGALYARCTESSVPRRRPYTGWCRSSIRQQLQFVLKTWKVKYTMNFWADCSQENEQLARSLNCADKLKRKCRAKDVGRFNVHPPLYCCFSLRYTKDGNDTGSYSYAQACWPDEKETLLVFKCSLIVYCQRDNLSLCWNNHFNVLRAKT